MMRPEKRHSASVARARGTVARRPTRSAATIAPKKPDGHWAQVALPRISDEILASYVAHGDLQHVQLKDLPSKQKTVGILGDLLTVLFPGWNGDDSLTETSIGHFLGGTMHSLHARLEEEVARSLKFDHIHRKQELGDGLREQARKIAEELLGELPEIKRMLAADVKTAYEDDPAATSLEEIVLSYPSLYAIATYRIAHELYVRDVPMIPRIMSEHAHALTGVDIHPGAQIGENFFIDHGTGVVIGETSEIGENVRIYQGVTLGAKSLPRREVPKLRNKKRHPTIEDNVVIYSGATILGGGTVIGEGSVIGGNVWITSSVPPHTTVTVAPPKLRKDG